MSEAINNSGDLYEQSRRDEMDSQFIVAPLFSICESEAGIDNAR